jgi:hypothetical protein
MLNLVDVLIRDVLLAGIPGFVLPAQVRFQPPDSTLRTDIAHVNRMVLCVYLVDLRENRKLRSNERVPTVLNGEVTVEPAPARVDCHYLITAWSPVAPVAGVEPELDEHLLLYQVIALLMGSSWLNPSRTYAAGSPRLNAWPVPFRDGELPTAVLPVEGFIKLSEFWTTMGQNSPWRPAVYLVVTVPVALLREIQGPPVTTTISDHRIWDPGTFPASGDIIMQIGGHVWNPATLLPNGAPTPYAAAWVQLEDLAGTILQQARTDDEGRFIFPRIAPSQYRIRAGVDGMTERNRVVTVPSETGEYDLSIP